METERLRQTHSKELDGKDEEVEDIRLSCSKKVNKQDLNTLSWVQITQRETSMFPNGSFEMCV